LPLLAVQALAEDCVADLGGVIDALSPVPPSQIQIDGNCTIGTSLRPTVDINFSFYSNRARTTRDG
jgi:hypothetical protein